MNTGSFTASGTSEEIALQAQGITESGMREAVTALLVAANCSTANISASWHDGAISIMVAWK